jgi:O-antigen/teichoic acid export membrane protein
MLTAARRLRDAWFRSELKFFRDFSVLAGAQVGSRVVGFLAFAFLARTLDPAGYGAVEYVVGVSLFFATLVESGLGVVGVRRAAQRPDEIPALAAQVVLARLGFALVCAPLMVAVAAPALDTPASRGLVWLFALGLLPRAARQDWLLQSVERMNGAALAQLLQSAVFALVVVALVRDAADVQTVGWAELAAVLAMALYCAVVQHAHITPFRWRAPLAGLGGLAREGFVVGLGTSVWTASQYAPLVLLAALGDPAETAWFAAASRIVGAVLAFSYVYHFNLYPAIARATTGDREQLAGLLAASFRAVAWGSTLIALVLTLLAAPLASLAFGTRFAPSAPLLAVLAWLVPVSFLSGHARWSLIAAGRQSGGLSVQVVGLVVVVGAGAPLVRLMGGAGAAVASLAGAVAVWVVAHVLAGLHGDRQPATSILVGPAALALAAVGGAALLGLAGWASGLTALLFALAPIVDRRLGPDLRRLGHAKLEQPPASRSAG